MSRATDDSCYDEIQRVTLKKQRTIRQAHRYIYTYNYIKLNWHIPSK